MEPVQRWTGSLLNARIGAASAGADNLEVDADDLLADEALEVIEPLPVGKFGFFEPSPIVLSIRTSQPSAGRPWSTAISTASSI